MKDKPDPLKPNCAELGHWPVPRWGGKVVCRLCGEKL
jgi:hypothetical protein